MRLLVLCGWLIPALWLQHFNIVLDELVSIDVVNSADDLFIVIKQLDG